MSRALIHWDGKLAERALYEFFEQSSVMDPVPSQCGTCCGMGTTLEQIDDDRLPVTVTCWRCKGKGTL